MLLASPHCSPAPTDRGLCPGFPHGVVDPIEELGKLALRPSLHCAPFCFTPHVACLPSLLSCPPQIVGSAPGFPHGVVDPIEELGKLALRPSLHCALHCIAPHVACLPSLLSCPPQIVGSAPGFPHGVVDPIEELGKLALRPSLHCALHCIAPHVACLPSLLSCPPTDRGLCPGFPHGVVDPIEELGKLALRPSLHCAPFCFTPHVACLPSLLSCPHRSWALPPGFLTEWSTPSRSWASWRCAPHCIAPLSALLLMLLACPHCSPAPHRSWALPGASSRRGRPH